MHRTPAGFSPRHPGNGDETEGAKITPYPINYTVIYSRFSTLIFKKWFDIHYSALYTFLLIE